MYFACFIHHQTYGIEISHAAIWLILKANNLSYKKAKAKPTKLVKLNKKLLKTLETLNTLGSLSNVVAYVLDESSVSVKMDSHSLWGSVGIPHTDEKNPPHDGINLVV